MVCFELRKRSSTGIEKCAAETQLIKYGSIDILNYDLVKGNVNYHYETQKRSCASAARAHWMKTFISCFAERGQGHVHRQLPALGLAALCLAATTGLSSCSRNVSADPNQKKPQVAAVPVLVSQAAEKEMAVQIRAIGNAQPYSKVTIRSQITGQLVEVHFQEGQEVKRGDLLCKID